MFAKLDIRKSALTLFAAAALSTIAGIASSAHASPLASGARFAISSLAEAGEHGTHQQAERNGHRLARPANRFNGFVGQPGGAAATAQAQ